MEGLLLSVHVLAGIIFVGGSAVAASLFPRYAPVAIAVPARSSDAPPVDSASVPAEVPMPDSERNRAVAVAMHRITRGYGLFGIIVPVAGILLALVQGRMSEAWVILAVLLTLAAGLLLALQIAPRQRVALAEPDDGRQLHRLSMIVGMYNVLWVIVVVLMIVRPGDSA